MGAVLGHCGLLMKRSGLGPELVVNGGFDTDTGWTKGSGWTISGGLASYYGGDTSPISQNVSGKFIVGRSYQVVMVVSYITGGYVNCYIPGASGADRSAAGTYTETLVCGSGGGTNVVIGVLDVSGVYAQVESLSIKEIYG